MDLSTALPIFACTVRWREPRHWGKVCGGQSVLRAEDAARRLRWRRARAASDAARETPRAAAEEFRQAVEPHVRSLVGCGRAGILESLAARCAMRMQRILMKQEIGRRRAEGARDPDLAAADREADDGRGKHGTEAGA
jgi:hypothetical protein